MRRFPIVVLAMLSVQGCCADERPPTTRDAMAGRSPTSRAVEATSESSFVEDIHVRIIARPPLEPPSPPGVKWTTTYLRLSGNGVYMFDARGHPVYYSNLEKSWRDSRPEGHKPFTLTVQVDDDTLERFSVAGLSRDISALRNAAWRAGLSLPDMTVEIIVRPLPPDSAPNP
jgi:hypothetical protein